MKKVLCIVAALAYLSNVHSQNNYPSESPLYYNLKDTITSQWKESVVLPVLQIVNPALRDSLDRYISVALENKYGQYEDSNGVVFTIGLTTYEPDTTNIHVDIGVRMNYYLYEYIVASVNHSNRWAPKDYWWYILGIVPYRQYIVYVTTNYRLPREELEVYFTKTEDSVVLRLFEEKPIRSVGTGIEPGLYYSVPLIDPGHFKSPQWPRKK